MPLVTALALLEIPDIKRVEKVDEERHQVSFPGLLPQGRKIRMFNVSKHDSSQHETHT
jgi:hypothetical protein